MSVNVSSPGRCDCEVRGALLLFYGFQSHAVRCYSFTHNRVQLQATSGWTVFVVFCGPHGAPRPATRVTTKFWATQLAGCPAPGTCWVGFACMTCAPALRQFRLWASVALWIVLAIAAHGIRPCSGEITVMSVFLFDIPFICTDVTHAAESALDAQHAPSYSPARD